MSKSTSHKIIKRIMFGFIILLLFLPMMQEAFRFVNFKPLNGYFVPADTPHFSVQTWLDGTYQETEQNFLNEHFGGRNFFVRLYNQLHFSLYNQAKANGVIVGKDNYLYEENYINAYLGKDFIGFDSINKKVNQLSLVSDTLKAKGVDLIVIFAPGKASFYPEFIPDRYQPEIRTVTNYEVYQKEMLASGVHFLDFHAWFREMKSTSPYPLYPRTGVHWSKYGELLAADSIIKYINHILPESIPELFIGDIETSNQARGDDDDIEKGMNLLFNIPDLEMAYPDFRIKNDERVSSAKVLTVADSYFWGMFNWGLPEFAFSNGQFWFYNEQIYPDSYESPLNVKDINIVEEVEKNDVVILMCTDANLHTFAFGFILQLYERYFDSEKVIKVQ